MSPRSVTPAIPSAQDDPPRHPSVALPRPTGGDEAAGETAAPQDLPLCVDLDGTLVRTDTLQETALACLTDWRLLPGLPVWLLRGRACLKQELARRAPLDAATLPYDEEVLAWLRAQKQRGRRLVLATAADRLIAERVNAHLGLFDDIVASDGIGNYRGTAKARALVERFGRGGFSYVGNDRTDLAVWREAGGAVLVHTPPAVACAAARSTPIEHVIAGPRDRLRGLRQALRPHQWLKNMLVFVPLITANAYGDAGGWLAALLMFLAFCATASAIYVINDLTDLAADRRHPAKRLRPFASGALPVAAGVGLAPLLLAVGAGFGVAAGAPQVLLVYALTSIAYSVRLKALPLVDVFTLAALYTLRLYGGGVATGHFVSIWLLAFSSFLFLSLSIVKRVAELMAQQDRNVRTLARRDYKVADLAILQMMGVAASFVSCMVLALYVQSDTVRERYADPSLLWWLAPLFLFWQCRIWLATARGYMHDDPVVYAVKDRISWGIGACVAVVFVLANWLGHTGLVLPQ